MGVLYHFDKARRKTIRGQNMGANRNLLLTVSNHRFYAYPGRAAFKEDVAALKKAGFVFIPEQKRWVASDPKVASKFYAYADQMAKMELDEIEDFKKRKKMSDEHYTKLNSLLGI